MNIITKGLTVSALVLSFSGAAAAAPEKFEFDDTHTAVTWQVTHMGFSRPTGKFMNIKGELVLDEANPANSSLEVTIPLALQESGVPKLDEHMKNADFFDIEKNPNATFKSTKVEVTGKDTANITGDLTLRGITKPVVLAVKHNKTGEHPMKKVKTSGFSATGQIKRSDFGMNYAVPMVSDEVDLAIEVEAWKKAE